MVEDIKIYATKEIRAFFQKKISEKSDPYESKVDCVLSRSHHFQNNLLLLAHI